MKTERKEGWQVFVEIHKNHVIKTPKTKWEIIRYIWKYLLEDGNITKLNSRAKKLIADLNQGIIIVTKSKIPKKYLADPEFLENGKIRQKKVVTIQDEINIKWKNGEKNEAKKIIDKFFKFCYRLWEYGIHEKPIKFDINFGVKNKEIVLIDFFEITDNKKNVLKKIREKHWKRGLRFYSRHLPKEIVDYYLGQAEKKFTVKALNKHWKKKIK